MPGQIDESILDKLRFVEKYDPVTTMGETLERAWGIFKGYEQRIQRLTPGNIFAA